MILLLSGDNTFTRHEAYQAICAAHDGDGALAANTLVLNGATVTLAELRVAALALPFLADHRLVRVDGLCGRFAPAGGRRRNLGEWDGLEDMLRELPPTTLLIFVDDAVTASNAIRSRIAAAGEVRDFPLLREREVGPWLRDRARALGIHLTPAAERQLVTQLGRDLWALAGELDKLRLYAADATIDEKVVASLAPVNREANIFQLVDAAAEGRTGPALRALAILRANGETPQRIIAMLARQMRMISVAREVLDAGGSTNDLQAQLDLRQFVAQRALDQARRYSQATADAALCRVLDADIAIQDYRHDRPGGLRDDLALELLVADLSATVAPPPSGRRARHASA